MRTKRSSSATTICFMYTNSIITKTQIAAVIMRKPLEKSPKRPMFFTSCFVYMQSAILINCIKSYDFINNCCEEHVGFDVSKEKNLSEFK